MHVIYRQSCVDVDNRKPDGTEVWKSFSSCFICWKAKKRSISRKYSTDWCIPPAPLPAGDSGRNWSAMSVTALKTLRMEVWAQTQKNHGLLLRKWQWLPFTQRAFLKQSWESLKRMQWHQDFAADVRGNNLHHYTTLKLWNSNSFHVELRINWIEQFDEIHPKRIYWKLYR